MRLYHSPNACSEGILLLLEECGAEYEVVTINLKSRAQRDPAYLAKNPKGKVPALEREDGSVLTEFPAIAMWLAKRFPEAGLIGDGLEQEIRTLELLEFIVASLHMRGFTLYRVPQKFLVEPEAQSALIDYGKKETHAGLAQLSEILGDKDYLLGRFSLADAAAWYVLRWARSDKLDLPANLTALYMRIAARPAARRSMGERTA